jgi:hypothetical protein
MSSSLHSQHGGSDSITTTHQEVEIPQHRLPIGPGIGTVVEPFSNASPILAEDFNPIEQRAWHYRIRLYEVYSGLWYARCGKDILRIAPVTCLLRQRPLLGQGVLIVRINKSGILLAEVVEVSPRPKEIAPRVTVMANLPGKAPVLCVVLTLDRGAGTATLITIPARDRVPRVPLHYLRLVELVTPFEADMRLRETRPYQG